MFDVKADSDRNFEQLTRRLLDSRTRGCGLRVAIASHNLRSIAHAIAYNRLAGGKDEDLELQILRGLGDPLQEAIAGMGLRVRAYCPVGDLVAGHGLPRAPAAREHLQRLLPGRPGARRLARGAAGATRIRGGEPGRVIAGAASEQAREQPRRGGMGAPAGRALGGRAGPASRARRRPRTLEGLAWAAWWLDDEPTTFAARERAHRGYRDGGRRRGSRAHGHLAGDRRARLPRRRDRRPAVAPARPAPARAARAVPRARLAGLPGGLHRPRGRRHRDGAVARGPRRPRSGGGSTCRTSRCSGWRSRGRRSSPAPTCAEGMRRLDEATAAALEDRAQIPISGAWTFCFLVSACMAVARPRARVGLVRPHRAFLGALQQPLHARLLPRRVRRAAPLARPLGRGGARAGGGGGRLRPLAPAPGRAARSSRSPSSAAARAAPTRPRRCSTGPAPRRPPQLCRARLDLDRARRPRGAASASSACCAGSPATGGSSARRRSSCSRSPAPRRGELDRAAEAIAALRDGLRGSARDRCARAPTARTACSTRRAATTSAARTLLEDAVDGYERAGTPYEAALARRDLAASLAALGRPERRRRARAAAGRATALRALSAAAASATRPTRSSALSAARARGAGADRRRAHEPADRRAARRSASTPCTAT